MPYEWIILGVMLPAMLVVPSLRNLLVPPPVPAAPADPAPPRTRLPFFDAAKGVAILAVILIHVTLLLTPSAPAMQWLLDVSNNLLRFAIPFFLISSGALLAPVHPSVQWVTRFLGRRLGAIGIPYALVVAGLGVYLALPVSETIRGGVLGSIAVPFYFVPVLFQLYVLYPVIASLARRYWFVWVALAISFVSYYVPAFRWTDGLVLFTTYFFFFVWGIYLRDRLRHGTWSVDRRAALVVLVLFVGLQVVIGTDRFYNGQFFYAIASFALFYTLITHNQVSPRVLSGLAWLGERSLWIFLTHFAVLTLLADELSARAVPEWGTILVLTLGGTGGGLVVGVACHAGYQWVMHRLQRPNKNRPSKA